MRQVSRSITMPLRRPHSPALGFAAPLLPPDQITVTAGDVEQAADTAGIDLARLLFAPAMRQRFTVVLKAPLFGGPAIPPHVATSFTVLRDDTVLGEDTGKKSSGGRLLFSSKMRTAPVHSAAFVAS